MIYKEIVILLEQGIRHLENLMFGDRELECWLHDGCYIVKDWTDEREVEHHKDSLLEMIDFLGSM